MGFDLRQAEAHLGSKFPNYNITVLVKRSHEMKALFVKILIKTRLRGVLGYKHVLR